MPTPARILRALADDRNHHHTRPSPREEDRKTLILETTRHLMAAHGRHGITLANLAIALRIGVKTLRACFADLDALFAEILHRHLQSLSAALGQVPYGDPDRQKKHRQIYYRFTHTALGGLTEAHLLLTRDRHLLPDDLRPTIEQIRDNLGETIAGPLAHEALLLLDAPYITLDRIESMLAALEATHQTAQPDKPAKHSAKHSNGQRIPAPASALAFDLPGAWSLSQPILLQRKPPPSG